MTRSNRTLPGRVCTQTTAGRPGNGPMLQLDRPGATWNRPAHIAGDTEEERLEAALLENPAPLMNHLIFMIHSEVYRT
ncbi:unnamed protein product [Boreogadus saida]